MDMVGRVARALIVPLGYPADVDWEATWIGNNVDSPETGSLAYLCRSLAQAAIDAMQSPDPGIPILRSTDATDQVMNDPGVEKK